MIETGDTVQIVWVEHRDLHGLRGVVTGEWNGKVEDRGVDVGRCYLIQFPDHPTALALPLKVCRKIP